MSRLSAIKQELHSYIEPNGEKNAQRFFKTGEGEYAAHDRFIGVRIHNIRKIARTYVSSKITDIRSLLTSPIHEERLLALIILVYQYEGGNTKTRNEIFKLYLNNTAHINNWDLVDVSAPTIVGGHLLPKNKRGVLLKLASSTSLWERRIAIVSTLFFIRNKDSSTTYQLAQTLEHDHHDLIQKAVGWMLREAGKHVSKQELTNYLLLKKDTIPRTTLRYAIEHYSKKERERFMSRSR